MKKRIAIICPAEIAIRRFLPSLMKADCFEFAGIGIYTAEERFTNVRPEKSVIEEKIQQCRAKAEKITNLYGGRVFESYKDVIEADDVDAVYIPLPPAFHATWVEAALKHKKHVLVEKPFSTSYDDACRLVKVARDNGLVLQENYMFLYHQQLDHIKSMIKDGVIGSVRLCRCDFSFPRRSMQDFRYDPLAGGGALYDAGGYTIRLATDILGPDTKVVSAILNEVAGFNVDIYGNGTLSNSAGNTVQVFFGMDNAYRCSLEIFGSTGSLHTGRIFTAPDDYVPEATVYTGNEKNIYKLPSDQSFCKSIVHFCELINGEADYSKEYNSILLQSRLVEEFRKKAQRGTD